MSRYSCKAFSILSVVVAAVGVVLPLNAQGMQELPPVPLSDPQGPSQLAPENKLAPGSTPVLPPVPGPINQVDADSVDGAEPMLRGPVHEAFAEQFNQNPVQGLIVPQQPPEPIEELPPDVRPDGRQVEWISGYWAWDDDDQDFFWVSGIWREVPQGARWLPGYWSKAETGYQWISGTWIPEQKEEIQYVEAAPPESLELGPVGLAPSQQHIWIPGCWNWNDRRYAWRPGYWSAGYSNWIWIPARHVWTPRGYLNCNGYWDYPLNRRGLLFAPYRFRRFSSRNRSRGFTPQVVIAINQLHWNLWVRPRSCHYYFGDYYGPRYANTGFQPWHQFHRQRRQFDPLYSHFSRSVGVGNVSFYDQVNGRFNLLTSHVDRRPARTFNLHEEREPSRLNDSDDRSPGLGSTIQQHIKEAGNTRFVKLQQDQRIRLQSDSKSVRQLADQRREVEDRGRLETTPSGHQTIDSVGRISNADQHDTERPDKPADSETRHGEKRSEPVKSVTPPPLKKDEPSNRLRLPPMVRNSKDKTAPPDTGSSSNVKAADARTPGSPVTRGERPRGVDSVLLRQKNPPDLNTVGAQNSNRTNNSRDSAARSIEPPDNSPGASDPQKSQNSGPRTNRRPEVNNQAENPRHSNERVESLPDLETLRRDVPGLKAPPRVIREPRPPSAGKPGGDAVHPRTDAGGSPRNETRTAPPSRPAAEKTRRTESAPAARPPRVQAGGESAAGGGGAEGGGAGRSERRRKK